MFLNYKVKINNFTLKFVSKILKNNFVIFSDIFQNLINFPDQNLVRKKSYFQKRFFKICEKICFNKILCFSVIMSKKASADQFSVSGGNLGQNRTRKTVFLCGKDFWGWLIILHC